VSRAKDRPIFSPLLLVEIAVYAALVAGYLVVALRALTPLLQKTVEENRPLYAAISVLLMLGQGLLLEVATSLLVAGLIRLAGKRSSAAKGLGN
jgi:hypothetical protein